MNAVAVNEENIFDAALKAAVIYDDFDLAARAVASLERSALRADETMKWRVKPWRLDALEQPVHAAAAAAEAGDADLIILALNQPPAVMESLLRWLDNWALRRQWDDAALLLFCGRNDAGEPLRSNLEWLARRRGLTFLGNHNPWDADSSLRLIRQLWQREQLVSAAFQSYAENPPAPPHWGINE
ncbi:MAG TPA: hypothetical protein VMB22_05005 [Verrucomicrobiae bacterium]|nr:hypothetical protein [Verrucomicrobiae bacterium]